MPLPPVPVTPTNHLLSIDTKLSAAQSTLEAIQAAIGGGLVDVQYDQIALTYDGAGLLTVVRYYQASVLVCTLTLSYDGAARLTGVVAVTP